MNGAATAIDEAWPAFSEGLRAFLRSRVSSDADADDLLQDVFVRVYEKIGSLRQPERMESWLYQIARNAIADFYRRRAARPAEAVESVVDPPSNSEPIDNQNRAVAASLLPMIEGLPLTLREAVRMYEIEGISQAEIARRLGISLSGAKSRVQRGRLQIEKRLRECCELQLDRRGNVIACKPANDNQCGQTACACDND